MTTDEQYKAVIENDESYDGIFYYAVKSTGIYCRPSCRSKVPKKDNVEFFDNADDAVSAGYRPCKRCRSDLLSYQPMKDMAQKVKHLIDEMFDAKAELNKELKSIGVTRRRMVDIFREQYGITPKEYMDKLRLAEAKRLLDETDDEIIDIAYSVGFSSLSAFYSFFKSNTGLAPNEYRKSTTREKVNDERFFDI